LALRFEKIVEAVSAITGWETNLWELPNTRCISFLWTVSRRIWIQASKAANGWHFFRLLVGFDPQISQISQITQITKNVQWRLRNLPGLIPRSLLR